MSKSVDLLASIGADRRSPVCSEYAVFLMGGISVICLLSADRVAVGARGGWSSIRRFCEICSACYRASA